MTVEGRGRDDGGRPLLEGGQDAALEQLRAGTLSVPQVCNAFKRPGGGC